MGGQQKTIELDNKTFIVGAKAEKYDKFIKRFEFKLMELINKTEEKE